MKIDSNQNCVIKVQDYMLTMSVNKCDIICFAETKWDNTYFRFDNYIVNHINRVKYHKQEQVMVAWLS